MKRLLFVLSLIALLTGVVAAQDPLAPDEVPGEVYYIPFPVTITVDGVLDDWAGVPVATVDRGPQPSSDPAENGSFTVAVTADTDNLYVAMTMPDQNIISGAHGEEYWNEDSLEFYFNLTDDINATAYAPGIFQMRIIPADIGNEDPAALTLSGVFLSEADVTGYVFETEDGWGFEVQVPLEGRVTPEHGRNIGFQAQANGASTADRDIKLIWSNADTSDNSWQNPSLFGTAIFYEIGQTDVPPAVERELVAPAPEVEEERPPLINLNQLGFHPDAPKTAVFAHSSSEPLNWVLMSEDGREVASGTTTVMPGDPLTGEGSHLIDFSAFADAGSGYTLVVDGLESVPFDIAPGLIDDLSREALAYFYRNRSGIELLPEYAGEQYARPAGHLSDTAVTCYKGTDVEGKTWPGCDYELDVAGGWYDAGDYGKYVVNGGISVWTLMNQYERNPSAWADGTLAIPENDNGVPDILDEARWEMEFLLSMQVPSGEQAGMAHHKVHDLQWDPLPSLPPTEIDNDNGHANPAEGRYLMPPSTAATLNLAATAAQCARIYAPFDEAFAADCLAAAETAWAAANAHPDVLAGSTPGAGGGDYGDDIVSDDFYWAAAELFTTTGDAAYLEALTASPYTFSVPSATSAMYWADTAALGTITLALVPNDLPAEDVAAAQAAVVRAADDFLAMMDANAYQIPVTEFVWGSNSAVLNNLLVMGLAYEFTGDVQYLDAVMLGMDYVLGRNPSGVSYVTGYGTYPAQHPHHRFWANTADGTYPPPPPGAVVGGPNANIQDPAAEAANLIELPPAQRYIDDLDSYATNEVAINWNAPLAWVAGFAAEHQTDLSAQGAPVEDAGAAEEMPEPEATAVVDPPTSSEESSETAESMPFSTILLIALGVIALLVLVVVVWRRASG